MLTSKRKKKMRRVVVAVSYRNAQVTRQGIQWSRSKLTWK